MEDSIKKYMRIIPTMILFMTAVLWPVGCKREVELDAFPVRNQKELTGKVLLPEISKWNADELKILLPNTESTVETSSFNILSLDNSSYQLVMAVYANEEIALLSPQFAGQTVVEFSAASSALSLLMINPLIDGLTEKGKYEMGEWFKSHPKFPQLVKLIEESLINKRSFLNERRIDAYIGDIILDLTTSSKRESPRIYAVTDTWDIGVDLNVSKKGAENGSLKLVNYGSALTYLASIKDESGTEVARLNLGRVSIQLSDIFLGLWDKLVAAVGAGPQKLFKFKEPEPQYYKFNRIGRYTLTIVNSKGDDNNSELQLDADLQTLRDVSTELLNTVSHIAGDYIKHGDCGYEIGLKLMKDQGVFFTNGKLDPKKLTDLHSFLAYLDIMAGLFRDIEKCNGPNVSAWDEMYQRKYITNTLKVIKTVTSSIRAISEFGSGVAIGMMASNAIYSTAVLRKCIEFDIGTPDILTFCGDGPLSPGISNTIEHIPMAISTGDPHLTTMDGYRYSFMAVGEFVALKSTTDKFEVQARQGAFGDQVSLNTGIAIHTGSDEVCIYLDQVYVNKKAIGMTFSSYELKNGGHIDKNDNTLNIRTPNSDNIEVKLFKTSLDYNIRLNSNRKGKVRGILGNFDGSPDNDLVTSTGQTVANRFEALYPGFSDSWRIRQDASLFVYGAGQNTVTFTDRTFPKKPVSITTSQRSYARSICEQAGVTDPLTLENCIMDVAVTGDITYAKRASDSEASKIFSKININDFNLFSTFFDLFRAEINNSKLLLPSTSGERSSATTKEKINYSNGYEIVWSFRCSNKSDLNDIGIQLGNHGLSFLEFSTKRILFIAIRDKQGYNEYTSQKSIFDGDVHNIKVVVKKNISDKNSFDLNIYIDDMNIPVVSQSIIFDYAEKYIDKLKLDSYGCEVLRLKIN